MVENFTLYSIDFQDMKFILACNLKRKIISNYFAFINSHVIMKVSKIFQFSAKQVFMAERKMAAGGAWHKACFNCRECHKCLDSNSIRERDQDIYCNRKCSEFFFYINPLVTLMPCPLNELSIRRWSW